MEEKKEVNELAERIEKTVIMRPFNVSACPLRVHERFTKLANEEFGDSYAMTIKGLLDFYDRGSDLQPIYEELAKIQKDIEKLKNIKGDDPLKTIQARFGGTEE